ncbi:uncharacterized protein K441DRAFT_568977, partial [Cenococcum geophilum 1.58]|uniref:uncharacterized protein n=1 Tax=Cenococcum geophilum 1.58 TaxID=794803 RepID=UPI00358FE016
VHPVLCFAWKHGLINIHNAMMADILHQLLKGIVMRLIKWIRKITSEVIPASKKRKCVFQGFRPKARDSDEGHFNFPKFYAMTHFMDYIRQFGAANGYNTSNGEAAYKYAVKAYWNRINKQSDFELQICLHNTRRVSVLATESWLLHCNSRTVSTAERSMLL